MRALAIALLAGIAAPALGQEPADPSADARPAHHDHGPRETRPMDHGAMDHGSMDHRSMDHGAMDHGSMDHGAMDHGAMDHGAMDHGAEGHDHEAMDIPALAPPPEAGSGPPRAADAVWGPAAMRASRDQLRVEHGGQKIFWFQADRAELRAREGEDGYLWDLQAYYGGDIDKLWLKSEGEGSFGERPEGAEVQALWSHAVSPWWDLQLGLRQDFAGPDRTHLAAGVQGLAPYLFEIDAAAFLSHKGELTARIEAELDQRITQSLVLQPRTEVVLSAQDISELGIGRGIDRIEAGLRLRYEIVPEFAPYIGIDQEWRLGGSADHARAAGHDPSVTNFVAGIRFWF